MAFKRPFHAQSRTPVRSSDLRRLREALASQFTALATQPDALKRLTADLQVCKATTHLGEPCTLYTAPNGDPRFFKLDPHGAGEAPPLLVPTCYATDLVPAGTLLPVLGTAEPVVQNLVSGSALFAAGVSPAHLAHLAAQKAPPVRAGDLVGITVASDPTQRIVAVGYLAADPKEIQKLQEQDQGGKAVLTLHARGDFLWQSGSKIDAPLPESQVRKADEGGDDDALTERLAATSLSRSPSSASSSAASTSAPAEPSRKQKKGKDKKERHGGKNGHVPVDAEEQRAEEAVTAAAAPAPAAELTPAEIDTILINALLLAISTSPALQKPATFPLSASSLYSSYILPSRPASPPSHATVEIKKSSFKKLDRFVKQAVKKGYLAAKELKKGTGEWIVTSVESGHPDAEKVPRYKTVAEAAAAGGNDSSPASASATAAAGEASTSSPAAATAGGAGAGGVQVRELWKLSGDGVKELFRSVPHERPPHDLYTTSDLSSLLRKYTDSHALSHPSHRSLLLIDPSASPTPDKLSPSQETGIALLARCVCKKGEDPREVGREKGSPGCVSREEALKRMRKEGCTGYWGMMKPGQQGEEIVKKGSPPTIKVAIKNVGKRQVTLISGHEPWDLFTSEELAEKLKHASASSTSIQPLAGSAKKGQTPKVEIMCQGTHDALVTKVLTAYGVPKSYIEVDLSKSKK